VTLRLVPFKGSHLKNFEVQPWQQEEFLNQPCADERIGESWTAYDGEKEVVSAGIVQLWEGRAYVWALLSVHAARHMLEITRIIKLGLDTSPYSRIEMYVDERFEQGQRWAEMLGFEKETEKPMRNYLPGGRGAYLYARVK